MAERVLVNIVGQIIGWLGSAAAQEFGSIWDVGDELQDLNNTLSTITALLLDAEDQQLHSHRVRNWLERLEDVVYHVDDLLDEFSTDQALQQHNVMHRNRSVTKVRTFFSASNQLVSRRKMALKVKKLRKTLDKIAVDRRDFHLEALPHEIGSQHSSSYRDTHSSVLEENVIGREADKMAIIKLVLDTKSGIEENVSVIPIIGIGGIGKTALAQLIFNDQRLEDHFDLKIWVWVSADFDVKLLVEKIITSGTYICPKDLEMEQLRRRLHGKLNKKRYLLVLDDVWNEELEKWESLRDLLVKDAKECRILVTTRSEKVAKLVGTVEPYHLEILDEDKSWSLFKKMAFGQEQEPADCKTMEIGKKIVKKCGGIPLAIRAIGGMLHFKNPETEWSPFVQKELLEISQTGNLDNMVLQTLRLSYDHLPSYLKHCLAYCSLFPKGHRINVEMLIHLWMAQGFIKSLDPSQDLEDIGRECFMELLWRCFFQEVEREDVLGNIKTCKMHDLMHDLAIIMAGKKCAMVGSNRGAIQKESRHLSFHFHLDSFNKIPTSWTQAKRIRSILLPSQSFRAIDEVFAKSFCEAITSNFKFLRMLELKKSGIKIVPESVGELKHLRYLDLSVNWDLQTLPNSITKLFNLQTLKLNHCRLKELPRDIKKLVNLRHLEIRENRLTRKPSGLCQLSKLRTLSQFVLSKESNCSAEEELNELGGLNNLRGLLEIKNLRHGMESKGANFKDKHHLHSLHLHWGVLGVGGGAPGTVDHGMTLEGLRSIPNLRELKLEHYKGVEFPSWIPFSFTNLVKLEFRDCVNCQHLPLLNEFPYLRMLKLENMPSLEYIVSNHDLSITLTMSSLRNLELYYLPNLKGWWRDVVIGEDDSFVTPAPSQLTVEKLHTVFPVFPCLTSLRIFNCPKLIFMPLYPHIEELVLENTSWKPFQTTIANVEMTQVPTMKTVEASSSSSCTVSTSSTLSKLRTLFLGGNENIQSLPTHLKALASLRELHISHCPKLKYLSSTFHHLASLETLKIRNCAELDITNDEEIMWKLFRSIRSLSFNKLPKLVALPEGLQHVTTLHHIEISHCNDLRSIPEWIQNFSSLATLEIWECPKLTSLPTAIQKLSSLETLIIYDCPILLQRCQRGGEDWPKIARIPVVDLC